MIPVISLFINVRNIIEECIRRTKIQLSHNLITTGDVICHATLQYVYTYSNKHSTSWPELLMEFSLSPDVTFAPREVIVGFRNVAWGFNSKKN